MLFCMLWIVYSHPVHHSFVPFHVFYRYFLPFSLQLNDYQAEKFYDSYLKAIEEVAKTNAEKNLSNGVSIKISALHPRYETRKLNNIDNELIPRLNKLIDYAYTKDVEITIDAEEQKVKDQEEKRIRENELKLKDEQLRLQYLEAQRAREERQKKKDEELKLKYQEKQRIREENQRIKDEEIRLKDLADKQQKEEVNKLREKERKLQYEEQRLKETKQKLQELVALSLSQLSTTMKIPITLKPVKKRAQVQIIGFTKIA